ncbi:MAG: gamma-glutamyltransferase, partial [Solirubrobacteraceae bacterium]
MSSLTRLAALTALLVLAAISPATASAQVVAPAKVATASGTGGAAASVDPLATKAAIVVLCSGGNAIDAAVAASGVLGVVEPFSAGIGGGGFMVVYDARKRRVDTIDTREAAPKTMPANAFIDPATGRPITFLAQRVSGLSVGVPGTVSGWDLALRRYGSKRLSTLLRPAIRIAEKGFVVDHIYAAQTGGDNHAIFKDFTSTRNIYLAPDGSPLVAGTITRNPELADTLRVIAERGPDGFYKGAIAHSIANAVRHPPVAQGATRNVRPGYMTVDDLSAYRALVRRPSRTSYRGYDVFGMGPPSSGGSTVGEALNILEGLDLSGDRSLALHRYLEASRLAYADRNAYLADPGFFNVPLRGLLSDGFAAARRALIGEGAARSPVAAGNPYPFSRGQEPSNRPATSSAEENGRSTTHLTVADRFGNVVAYTFTIEQIGGSGIVVPGRGFLLNNELTDFNVDSTTHPNAVGGGKRPRSSMSPAIVFRRGRPVLALGSPGGATIITTVLQTLVNSLDFKLSLPDAIAAPRASQRNSATTEAEQAFIDAYGPGLGPRGHRFATPAGGEIGTVAAIRMRQDGSMQAAAEPKRRGGGHAAVVRKR